MSASEHVKCYVKTVTHLSKFHYIIITSFENWIIYSNEFMQKITPLR